MAISTDQSTEWEAVHAAAKLSTDASASEHVRIIAKAFEAIEIIVKQNEGFLIFYISL